MGMAEEGQRLSEQHGLNQHANQTVLVEIMNPSSSDARDDGYVSLRIEDAASGETLVGVEIPAGRFYRLLQGGSQTWPAQVSDNLDRLGKKMRVKVIRLGRFESESEAIEEAHGVRRDLYREGERYDEMHVRRTNSGWEAVYRAWEEA